jgi:hypothetical protein
MANADPHQARAARKRRRAEKAGSPADLQALVWRAITAASEVVADPATDTSTRLRAVHAVTQAAASYTKLIEAVEFDARLRAIEEAREQEHAL